MERIQMAVLEKWKDSKDRKPLIVKGARQTGKSWLVEEFGRRYFENCAVFNFEENPEYKQFFELSKDVKRIISNLSMAGGYDMIPGKTLIFFDEIQNCPEAIGCLKYFYERAPEYHVIAAGSLLGIALAHPTSFPVGKVNFLDVEPMTFSEFLIAEGEPNLASYLKSYDSLEPIADVFFNRFCEKLKMYFVTGGMPEAVKAWADGRSVENVERVLGELLRSYELDFAKHAQAKDFPKIMRIWGSLPSQLSKENKKFAYKTVKEGARAREYEDALSWLVNSNLVRRVNKSTAPRLPLSSYDDETCFKLYMLDVGLLRKHSSLSSSAFSEGERLFTEFKGAVSENYILQAISRQLELSPRYWAENNPPHEVDFIVQIGNDVIPIEVKAGKNVESRSLKVYQEKFSESVKIRVRFALNNLRFDGNVLSIPLFMADEAVRLIKIALEKRKDDMDMVGVGPTAPSV